MRFSGARPSEEGNRMTVSVVTAGSTTAAVVGVGASQLADPRTGVSTAASALAFTGAPHLALEGFIGALFVMTGLLLAGLARRHRARPAAVPVAVDGPIPEDPLRT
jgi:hypothetical protein